MVIRYFILWEEVLHEGFAVHSWWEDEEQAHEEAVKLKRANPTCAVVLAEEIGEVTTFLVTIQPKKE